MRLGLLGPYVLCKLNEGATGNFGHQFSRDWRVTGAAYKRFPDRRPKVGLLVDGTKEESNKDGADEAGTGG